MSEFKHNKDSNLTKLYFEFKMDKQREIIEESHCPNTKFCEVNGFLVFFSKRHLWKRTVATCTISTILDLNLKNSKLCNTGTEYKKVHLISIEILTR